MKVRITKSNCTFVRRGDVTQISICNGRLRMWSERQNKWEWRSWVTGMWGVEYKELDE